MQIADPRAIIVTPISRSMLKEIEAIGRTCYKSEEWIDDVSAPKFVKQIVKSGHHSVLEHHSISVRFIHNRGFTHELVRHRLAAYSQESTRYCNYLKNRFGNELTFIKPYWWDDESIPYIGGARNAWLKCMELAEINYKEMINCGLQPQAARGILPNDLKTEIVMTANLREWLHVFKLRTAQAAHPDMRRIMIPLRTEFQKTLPEIFLEDEA